MSTLLTQNEFDRYAADWAGFLDRAAHDAGKVQRLFTRPGSDGRPSQYQASVTFSLGDDILALLSTPNTARIMARFVLLPKSNDGTPPAQPRFRVVLYAVDALGGRISAYYLGAAEWQELLDAQQPTAWLSGQVSFNLVKQWIQNWCQAAGQGKLQGAMFRTGYGPLQGYNFELSDFTDPLFVKAQVYDSLGLRVNFDLKAYYPAFPEQSELVQTFGLVVRLYSLDGKSEDFGGGDGGSSSYDIAKTYPPY